MKIVNVTLALLCVSCVSAPKVLAEPERTLMYMQMINQSGFPVTVVQCIESKIDFTRPIESKSQVDAMTDAAKTCIEGFKETESGKRFMKFLESKMGVPEPSQQEHVEVI